MKSKHIVAKKNVLVPEFVKLAHQEKRFLAYCISTLNPKEDKTLGRFTVNIGQIADVFGLPLTSTYPRIKEAATAINARPILRKEGKASMMDFWFSWLDYYEDSGDVEIQFNERLLPLLVNLKSEYIQYPLSMVADFSNRAWTLYEVLKQWLPASRKHFTLDELKDALGVVGKYPRWADFKIRNLTPAIEEINEKSDIKVSYVCEKQGRRIIGLEFRILKKKPGDEEIIDLEPIEEQLFAALVEHRVRSNVARTYLAEIATFDKTKVILDKLPGIVKAAQKTNAPLSAYILKSIKNELHQNPLPGFGEKSSPPAPEHQEALDCWMSKTNKRAGERCKVRERGTPGQRKKCQICFEKIPADCDL